MKRWIVVFSIVCFLPAVLFSQVSLTVLGSASGGTMTSGDLLSWEISQIPAGATTHNELWLDINSNGVLDPATDMILFMFDQMDGATSYDGPGDDDGVPNGIITTSFPAGLAPAHWIFVVKYDVNSAIVPFVVAALASPAATITGTVSVPAGYPKANFIVEAGSESGSGGGMNPFWHALTDANGDFTIEIGSVAGDPATMNPWRVSLAEGGTEYGRLVATKRDTSVNLGGATPVVSFELVEGTILTGTVTDESMNPLYRAEVYVEPVGGSGDDGFGMWTDNEGVFAIAVPPGDYYLHFGAQGYFHEMWDNVMDHLSATVLNVTTQDSIKNLNASLTKGAEIKGHVTNYGSPVRAQVIVLGSDYSEHFREDTRGDGSFSLTVSPGTYFLRFEYEGNILYYDNKSTTPADPIVITGTETVENIDADFAVGEPPMPDPPQILNIWDVPFDNGRHVYVKWQGIDKDLAMMMNSEMPFGIQSYSIWRQDGQDWVYQKSIPAVMESTYTAVVRTLKDSTMTEGMFQSTFIVRAHFIFNMFVLTSDPANGYSLDNMAPGVPAGLGTAVTGGDVVLRWQPNEDEDFKYYSVYRSSTPDFSVQGLTPYALTATTEYIDAGAAGGTFYYRITATDHAGNESEPSLSASSSGTTAAELSEALPTSFALYRNYPNPFNPTTTISFDLPEESHVKIVVYNAIGEVVGTIVNSVRQAGTHTATFDAAALPSGLYIYRMQAGDFQAVQKMSLIK